MTFPFVLQAIKTIFLTEFWAGALSISQLQRYIFETFKNKKGLIMASQ